MRIENGQPVREYRVTALYYRFRSEVEEDRFDQAAGHSGILGPFGYELRGGVLKAIPSEDFQSRDDAKAALERYLRDWEQVAYLTPIGHRIRFKYERSEVEEINPVSGFVFLFAEDAVGVGSAHAAAVITRNNATYPRPDPHFRRTAITDRLAERLRRVREGKTELPTAAYFLLSTLEQEFGGSTRTRGQAASTLAVDRTVLDRLGDLSSRADPELGRKGKGNVTALTVTEMDWMRAAMVRLTYRVGEHARGDPMDLIALGDLPAFK